MKRLIVIGLAAVAGGTLLATPADAATNCNRTKYGAVCDVTYQAYPSHSGTLTLGIRNNYGSPGFRNTVETNTGWLDSDNDRNHRHWNGRVGVAGQRYWRGFANYWRACTGAWKPSRFVCTPWVGKGPAPFGSPAELWP